MPASLHRASVSFSALVRLAVRSAFGHAAFSAVLLLVAAAAAPGETRAQSSNPLNGRWKLNVPRSHYGGGADARRDEVFACDENAGVPRCSIHSVLTDGRVRHAIFAAIYDGNPHTVSGNVDVDHVTLRRVNASMVDATFSGRGTPLFGYRASLSNDLQSLTIVSVHPVTRTVEESIIVYDRVSSGRRDGRMKH